jgi:hypothetical protein
VEGADDVVAVDAPAVAKVGAQVRAVCIEQRGVAVLAAKEHVILSEVAKGLHFTRLELAAPAEEVPTLGELRRGGTIGRERRFHGRSIGSLSPPRSL